MPETEEHRTAAPRWAVPVVPLLAAVCLLAGVGVAYLFFRPDPRPSVFSGPRSITKFHLPAHRVDLQSGEANVSMPSVALPFVEPQTAREALDRFLDAEAKQDATGAFALLDGATKQLVKTPTAWQAERANRLVADDWQVIASQVSATRATFTVTAVRQPKISSFTGFVPAKSTDTWVVVRSTGGWRIEAGTPASVDPMLPADATAVAAAQRYADALARCDGGAAHAAQLSPVLVGDPDLQAMPCHTDGAWRATTIEALSDLPNATPVVAAYGSGVGHWARAVAVVGPSGSFTAVLAPLGDEWRVLGLLASGSGGQ